MLVEIFQRRTKLHKNRRAKNPLSRYYFLLVSGIFLVVFFGILSEPPGNYRLDFNWTSSLLESTTRPESVRPLSCSSFLEDVQMNRTSVIDPNNGHGLLKKKMVHGFWASFHHQNFDRVRYPAFLEGRYYEKFLIGHWQNILVNATSPGSRVIDVGGNIGFYSLLTASMGPFVVDSFEPNLQNALRFCEAIVWNRWKNEWEDETEQAYPRINVYPYGIGDEVTTLPFYANVNPGAGSFVSKNAAAKESSDSLPLITLDSFARQKNWFQTRPNILIMKIDVESMEANVLFGARELLQARLIKNIFNEFSGQNPKDMEALRLLVDTGYSLTSYGFHFGPNKPSPWTTNGELPEKLHAFLNESTLPYLNLWWVLKDSND